MSAKDKDPRTCFVIAPIGTEGSDVRIGLSAPYQSRHGRDARVPFVTSFLNRCESMQSVDIKSLVAALAALSSSGVNVNSVSCGIALPPASRT